MTDIPTALPAEYSRAQHFDAAEPPQPPAADQRLCWSHSLLTGRLAELSSWGTGASLTLAFELVLQAQHGGEPVAWITTSPSTFFPPDVAHGGVDLDALPVVRVPDGQAAARAADKLVRSGAFGLVILDLGANAWEVVVGPLHSNRYGPPASQIGASLTTSVV